ncbi:MAG: CopG family transcriptional regulator [Bacilli bacterium]|nr:CopG family transcriptional regulator [Bacilli bacterium]
MPVTSVRLTDEESGLIRSYCAIHGISMSDALKRALIERIEDEFDLAEYEAAKRRYDENPVSYSLEEVRKELDLK